MGTRNLTMVVQGGEFKVCQYGQWDGYPSGQGLTVLEFLEKWDRPKFEAKVSKIHLLTQDEIEALNATNWKDSHPQLSRDVGAEILQEIQYGDDGIELYADLGFAGDSLMCEWAYLIDLDRNNLEVYRGFNKTPLSEGDRFYKTPLAKYGDMGYQQIRLVKSYYLSELPTVEQMELDCRNRDQIEEEEAEEEA